MVNFLNIIADATTQPAAWRSWGPVEWSVVLAALSGAIVAIIKSFITAKQATMNTASIHEANRTIATVASLAAPADPPSKQTAPPTPSTESVAAEMSKAFDGSKEINTP